MTISDDEDDNLAHFLESEVLSQVSDCEEEEEEEKEKEKEAKVEEQPKAKRLRVEQIGRERQHGNSFSSSSSSSNISILNNNNNNNDNNNNNNNNVVNTRRIETGILSKIPPELFLHILKFLSSEDLISCSLVCKFLSCAASDESLWRRLYCLRWGLLPPTKKLRESAWKKLYIQRDGEDLMELVRNCPPEFKEYYIQMQAAKRSQAPLPSQVKDDCIILDKTVADQISMWKSKRGFSDKVPSDHTCSGETCTYYQIGDVYICEKTGLVHVCDDTCREVIMDPANELLVCTISGHCFDRLLSPEMEPDPEQFQGGVTDEAEPFMGSGRFARAYLLGYNCTDEKDLEDTLRFC